MSESTASSLGRVLLVGAGSMGQAILAGLMRVKGIDPANVTVANPGAEKRELVASAYGIATVPDAVEGLPADTVVLAVKPNIVPQVARQLSAAGAAPRLVVSIAAGVSTDSVAACFDEPVSVVRVMPNTPLQVGKGIAAVSRGACATDADVAVVRTLFESMGSSVEVAEDLQDVVTAVSGSGPAYFELVCEQIARSAEKLGMPYETARDLAVQTMYGTGALIAETGQDLPAAIEAVSSPGGTTVAALDAMRSHGIEDALDAGVAAAAARSKELGA